MIASSPSFLSFTIYKFNPTFGTLPRLRPSNLCNIKLDPICFESVFILSIISMALLLGPPELCDFSVKEKVETGEGENDFIEMLKRGMVLEETETSLMGRTENCSPTYLSSGDACLDFFFHVVPDTPSERVVQLLEAAWKQNPLMALKLVCQLRGVRGTGKSDREGFYAAVCWMHSHHPKTLLANLSAFAEFGYHKDLPEMLLRILQGPQWTEERKAQKEAHKMKKELAKARSKRRDMKRGMFGCFGRRTFGTSGYCGRTGGTAGYFARKGAAAREAKKRGTLRPREERIEEDLLKGKQKRAAARVARRQKLMEDASRAVKRYTEDSSYRALHDEIAQHFASLLAKDLAALNSGKLGEISLAAKWCPSLDSSYDLSTLLCENIAKRVFPREEYPDVVDERHYAYRVRDRLRKQVLVPLRKALQLPEVYMSANLWGQLPYSRVASVAMKNYKKLFLKHDEERFNQFLEEVERGERKIAAGALLPHEIVAEALFSDEEHNVAELQWRRMVEDMTKEGKLSDSLAVCDVSGSMMGLPMEVCIALGLLVSELSAEPWKGHVITFSANPKLHLVQGNTLAEKYSFTEKMDWDGNTDFQRVFDEILTRARKCKLQPEKMIKQLFVFSDMEFDEASLNPWETDYMVIKRKYREAGYGAPPKIVFWNLRDSQSTPVMKEEKGVAMVSGFSKNLLKLFLSNGEMNATLVSENEEMTPMLVLHEATAGEMFERLVVLD